MTEPDRVDFFELAELAELAKRTHNYFQEHPLIAGMTEEQAAWVRKIRGEEHNTWRGVAAICAEEWGGDWDSNQIAGIAICEKAASFYGQNAWTDEPWN